MELATLICANTRRRAIEIAIERSLLPSAMQNDLRYVPGAGSTTQWAYIDSEKAIFGRPEKSLIIFDDSARKLFEWQQILNYAAAREFRCEWVGDWTPAFSPRKQDKQRLIDRLNELGICAVCKKPAETVLLYEGPGLVHFIHGQGKECRVAVDMRNLRAALETLIKAVKQAAFSKAAAVMPQIIREQQRVPAEVRELPGTLERAFQERIDALNAGAQQANLVFSGAVGVYSSTVINQEKPDNSWEKIEAIRDQWLDQKTYDRLAALQNQASAPSTVIDPPKPVLPAVVSRTTVRKVRFD